VGAGLSLTLEHLTKTKNVAAVELLIAGLASSHPATRAGSLRALLDRPNPAGHDAVFQNLKRLDSGSREIIGRRSDRLTRAAVQAVRSSEAGVCAAACEAVLAYRLYDVLPALGAALTRPGRPNAPIIADTILKLTELFYRDLCAPSAESTPKNVENLRRRLTSTLEEVVQKYSLHCRRETIEAFLLLAKPQNIVLRLILRHTQDANHRATVEVLSSSSQGGILRLLLGFLKDQQPPQVVKNVLSGRSDLRFVEHLLETVGDSPPRTVREMLSRIDRLAWAEPGHELLAQLDESGQRRAVRLVSLTSIPRDRALRFLDYLLKEGNDGGRRAAAAALAEFPGEEADRLILESLSDKDPAVRACAIRLLRPRAIPGAMSLLIDFIDCPEKEVRQALHDALPEFIAWHFVRTYQSLPDGLLATAGNLVRKLDPAATATLSLEMRSPSRARRLRAVESAVAMGLMHELELSVRRLLNDEDHMVRVEAAKSLAGCDSMPTWEALRDALLDRSVAVQEAAERSLQQISRSLAELSQPEEDLEVVLP
jgi:HEAT repeat protein